jgi:hypothetical protein
MPKEPNPGPGNVPQPHNFLYPEPADVLSEYPVLARAAMERITVHTHPELDKLVEAQRARVKVISKIFTQFKRRKYAVPRHAQVTQNGDPKKGALGFSFPAKTDKQPMPVPNYLRTVVSVVSEARCFCQYDTRTDKWVIYQLAVSTDEKGGPTFTIESKDYTVVYFTWDRIRTTTTGAEID